LATARPWRVEEATWTNQALEGATGWFLAHRTATPAGDDTVVVNAASELMGDAGEARGVLPSGDGRGMAVPKGRVITVNGKVKQMHSRYQWWDRRGKTLRKAADALIVKNGNHDGVRAAFEQVLERRL
jgi:hypothetical protein